MTLTRRNALTAAGAFLAAAAPLPEIRLGVLQFGTVQWVADVIRRHDLDTKHGFALRGTILANTDAGRVSLMAGASDIILADWPFAAAQRAAGVKLSFAPFSSASGGVMVPAASPVRDLPDLKGRRLGIAGGPADKSWLVVRAAAKTRFGLDLAAEANCIYGAPPLLGAKLQQGELDAVLTFWNFAAKLEADGFHEAVSVADCEAALGISPRIAMVGFVFRDDAPSVDPFLAAVREAQQRLAGSPDEWTAVRPLMNAPDDALFANLRQRFESGLNRADAAEQAEGADKLLKVLHGIGGAQASGGLESVPAGVFWPVRDGAG